MCRPSMIKGINIEYFRILEIVAKFLVNEQGKAYL